MLLPTLFLSTFFVISIVSEGVQGSVNFLKNNDVTHEWNWESEEGFEPRTDSWESERTVKCGQAPLSGEEPEEKIVNGTVSIPNAFPFMVDFKFKAYHLCGAAIYDKYHVITAAHCITKKMNTETGKLVFANWDLKERDPGQFSRKIAKIIKHPDAFEGQFMNNDIAILKVESAIKFSKKVQPICMPSGPVSGGEAATVMGWGYTLGTNKNRYLIQADVPIISRENCTQDGWYSPNSIGEGMLCAGYEEGQIDSCQGDSGGPLVRKVGGAYELTGLVSWGSKCAQPKKPGVYTNVYQYVDWIKQVAGEPRY